MKRRPSLFLIFAALALLAASLACYDTVATPPAQSTQTVGEVPTPAASNPTEIPGQPTAVDQPGEPPIQVTPSALPPVPAIPERRRLTLEFPPRIRAGDSDIIRLSLEMDDLGNLTPTAVIEGNEIIGEVVEIPNLYQTHTVFVEARLDLAGVEVTPAETTSSTLLPGQTATFYWSVSPREAGTFRGTVWLHLRFVDKVSGEESRRPISAQTIEIQGTNILGFSGNFARTAGLIGSIVGTVIGFPFLEDILKFFWRRRRKSA
jgi:hypothetical protein